tara:strand:+ start:886 stop:1116 length:231 start_codon:yes stop_codon:yes gene_type:complete
MDKQLINREDIPNLKKQGFDDETIKQLFIIAPKKRETKFTQECVRTKALQAMNVLASLSKSERDRVLRHCLKLNQL